MGSAYPRLATLVFTVLTAFSPIFNMPSPKTMRVAGANGIILVYHLTLENCML